MNEVKGARAKATSGEVTRRKERNYGATGKVEVVARFYWNSKTKTVRVLEKNGDLIDSAGISKVKNKKTTVSGDNTSRATVKFSCKVNKNLGGWSTYSVKVSCNYKGKAGLL